MEESVADYAYVVMAQPLSNNCPSFCISVFGTDNKFTYSDVLSRWEKMKTLAQKNGIEILGFSSDGDTRLLKCMRLNSQLPVSSEDKCDWKWFAGSLNPKNICIQDTVHIGTKLRTRFIKPSILLPFGKYIISSSHLKYLIDNVSKDQHLLTESDLNANDKMNFQAVEKISCPQVINLLKKLVPDSQGTIVYLSLINDILNAFLNKSITSKRRLYLMWKSVFILRIWRHWILKSKSYKVSKNFLSLNSYLCIEINAHALVVLMRQFSTNSEKLRPEMFLPWLMSSQPCEQIFRSTRSMTSTFSTVVNYSMLEIIQRIRRIQFLQDVVNDLKDSYCFPRENVSRLGYSRNENNPSSENINDDDIEKIVMSALDDALETMKDVGITVVSEDSYLSANVPVIKLLDIYQPETSQKGTNEVINDDDLVDDPDSNNLVNYKLDSHNISLTSDLLQCDTEEREIESLILDDLIDPNLINFLDDLDLKDYNETKYESEDFFENSPFIKVLFKSSKTMVLRKSSLCWLFSSKKTKLSSDRLLRVQQKVLSSSESRTTLFVPEQQSYVNLGDWCIFKCSSTSISFMIGRILSFRYMKGVGKKTEYSLSKVSVLEAKMNKGKFSCLCNWYNMDNASGTISLSNQAHEFSDIGNYVVTIPHPTRVVNSDGHDCSVKFKFTEDILVLIKNYIPNQEEKSMLKIERKPKTPLKINNANSPVDDSFSSLSESELDSDITLHDTTNVSLFSNESEDEKGSLKSSLKLKIEQYYAVYYSDLGWYIGRIIEKINKTIKMKFLKEDLQTFYWPKPDDIQIIQPVQIIYGPIKMIGCNPFSISRTDRCNIIARYKDFKRQMK